mgnify:CR=1 FL=1
MEEIKARIEACWGKEPDAEAVRATIAALDEGAIRVAECHDGEWIVNDWIKKAILMYFRVAGMETHQIGPYEFYDKIPLKQNLAEQGVRLVPPGHVRYGSFLEAGAIVMPGYVNIGAYVGAGTMVDTWATVGSCGRIGKGVDLSGGVGIGGVLEPPAAKPVIIEDGAFIGSRSIVVEGVQVKEEAVLGANVVLTASTKIIDVTGETEKIYQGIVPPRSVVIPGSVTKKFPAGDYGVACALIIGKRKESTDRKTSLNQVLRDFAISV